MTGLPSPPPAAPPDGGGGGAVPTAVRFSTRGLAGLSESRRIELWEAHNAASLVGLRCRTLAGTSLEASETNLQLPRLHLAHVEGNSHVVERTADVVRASPTDSVALYFTLVGEAFFYHDEGVRTVRPGQLLLCDVDRPFMRGFSQGLEELAVKIPKSVFGEISDRTVPTAPVVLDFDGSPHVNLYAQALARAVARSVGPRGNGGGRPDEDALLDLVATLLEPANRSAASHYAAAEAYIRQRLRSHDLSAARIARGIGVSERHLSRIFAEEGTSVPRYIQQRRVELAERMLRAPSLSSEPVERIALRCGFTSVGHFSRVYREHTGTPPGAGRRRTRGEGSGPC
ncbi:helix-turn-helix domain-containing protein [Streptomyces sp. TS71-3]|uniref:helix-turn-helix domain-containing protein n=1 Tax=Streptomyces sp. TS71-3 TaxID=2733862 RepID=UPI001B23E99D|nr:helix-turn-helix domain-containing protein [Streptomyces sp. TS71-3]GHJ41355.1 AraC family transcriptional regulator [Streptomyces sp. TS71-3]